jgi:hypothetical protein
LKSWTALFPVMPEKAKQSAPADAARWASER